MLVILIPMIQAPSFMATVVILYVKITHCYLNGRQFYKCYIMFYCSDLLNADLSIMFIYTNFGILCNVLRCILKCNHYMYLW